MALELPDWMKTEKPPWIFAAVIIPVCIFAFNKGCLSNEKPLAAEKPASVTAQSTDSGGDTDITIHGNVGNVIKGDNSSITLSIQGQ